MALAAAAASMSEASAAARALPAGAAAALSGAPPPLLGARWLASLAIAAPAPATTGQQPLTLASLGIPEHEVEEGA